MKFKVKAAGRELPVEFRFGAAKDFRLLECWDASSTQPNDPLIDDALEYRSLAGKRWRSYSDSRRTVSSFAALRKLIRKDPESEVVFVLVAHANWHALSPILGFCFCRRTWCHHIVLDFAAAHPNAIQHAGGAVAGIGSGMLYGLVAVARRLGVKFVWGEATRNSVAFYEKVLKHHGVTDHFFIQGEIFKRCLQGWENVRLAGNA